MSGRAGQPQTVAGRRPPGIRLGTGADHDAGKLTGVHGDIHAAGLFTLHGVASHRAEGKTLVISLGSLAENGQRGIIKQEAVLFLGEGLFEKRLRGKAVREDHGLALSQLFVQQLLCLRTGGFLRLGSINDGIHADLLERADDFGELHAAALAVQHPLQFGDELSGDRRGSPDAVPVGVVYQFVLMLRGVDCTRGTYLHAAAAADAGALRHRLSEGGADRDLAAAAGGRQIVHRLHLAADVHTAFALDAFVGIADDDAALVFRERVVLLLEG